MVSARGGGKSRVGGSVANTGLIGLATAVEFLLRLVRNVLLKSTAVVVVESSLCPGFVYWATQEVTVLLPESFKGRVAFLLLLMDCGQCRSRVCLVRVSSAGVGISGKWVKEQERQASLSRPVICLCL